MRRTIIYVLIFAMFLKLSFKINAAIITHQTSVPDGYTGIYKIEQLYDIRNNLEGNYILMNDLDFDVDRYYTNPNDSGRGDLNGDNTDGNAIKTELITSKGWRPIGSTATPFTGTFDGNGYSRLIYK